MDETGDRSSPDISFEFGRDLSAPRAARVALEPLFPLDGELGDDALAEDVGLVASELVSNVVMHTHDGGRLDAWDDNPLRLEVHDHDPGLPERRRDGSRDDTAGIGGRGLHIVDGVASRWGAQVEDDGKVIWAEFAR